MMRTGLRLAMAGGLAALLGACHGGQHGTAMAPQPVRAIAQPQAQPQGPQMVWVRTDGQRGRGNPELERQYQEDTAACPGATQMSPAAQSCMGQRGYALVPLSQADAALAEYARLHAVRY